MHSTALARRAYKFYVPILAAGYLLISPPAAAQEIDGQGLWAKSKAALSSIAHEGQWDMYLSGYAYHGRGTYTNDRIKKLNEKAWGAGLGKTIRNDKGNDESVYAMVIRDSNERLQWMAGYSYQWLHPISTGNGWEVGAGIAALVIRRHDWFDGVPFPAALPIASIGTRAVKLMGTFVPRISTPKGKGDVVLLFAKVEFD